MLDEGGSEFHGIWLTHLGVSIGHTYDTSASQLGKAYWRQFSLMKRKPKEYLTPRKLVNTIALTMKFNLDETNATHSVRYAVPKLAWHWFRMQISAYKTPSSTLITYCCTPILTLGALFYKKGSSLFVGGICYCKTPYYAYLLGLCNYGACSMT